MFQKRGNSIKFRTYTNFTGPVLTPWIRISVYDTLSSSPKCENIFTAGENVPGQIDCTWAYPFGKKRYGVYAVTTFPDGVISQPLWEVGPMRKRG